MGQCIDNRRNLITALLVLHHSRVLEYDIVTYRKISLLLEHLDFHFIITFILPINFPAEPFSLSMHSVYHMTEQGKPVHKNVENFPYSPRWLPKQMIVKALNYIVENEIQKFQEQSVRNLRF